MTPSRPYILRAIYEWLVDNQLTPYLMVDALQPFVQVPEQFIEEGQIVLNISPKAVAKLSLSNEAVQFNASFSGVPQHIYVPIAAVKAIYAFENGRGMIFSEEEEDDGGDYPPEGDNSPPKKGPPNLKIVK